ncbi:hypothetical protein RV03_GL002058 [Enterococcus gallinarum]|nr:hypothetical protein RV03_GL002058 [Enterococcus gallinarum]
MSNYQQPEKAAEMTKLVHFCHFLDKKSINDICASIFTSEELRKCIQIGKNQLILELATLFFRDEGRRFGNKRH